MLLSLLGLALHAGCAGSKSWGIDKEKLANTLFMLAWSQTMADFFRYGDAFVISFVRNPRLRHCFPSHRGSTFFLSGNPSFRSSASFGMASASHGSLSLKSGASAPAFFVTLPLSST